MSIDPPVPQADPEATTKAPPARRSRLVVASTFGVLALGAFGVLSLRPGGSSLESGQRIVYMAAVEPKGTTTTDGEPFPAELLPPGDGYQLQEPVDGEWTASTYMWSPSTIVVVQGDQVTLQIFGVNGASHPSTIEGYDIGFEVRRGRVTRVQFDADRAGTFQIVCHLHQPSMTAQLVVLPA